MRASFVTLLASIRAAISFKDDPDTITPDNIGEDGFAATLQVLDDEIRDEDVSGGDTVPTGGQDGDVYLQGGTTVVIWQKISGVWTAKGTIDLGITFPDGNSTLKTSLDEGVVTVTPGFWYINNTQYAKATQTQFNISTADPALETQDLIYANESNQVLFTAGTPGGGVPVLPSDTVLVDVVVIPALSAEAPAYLSLGFTDVGSYVKNLGTVPDPDLVLQTAFLRLAADNLKNPFLGSGSSGISSIVDGGVDGYFGWQEMTADDAPFRKKGRAITASVFGPWVNIATGITTPILIENTSNGSGEYELTAPEIADVGEFPDVTIYDATGLTSPAQYDNTNHKIINLNLSETFKARFK